MPFIYRGAARPKYSSFQSLENPVSVGITPCLGRSECQDPAWTGHMKDMDVDLSLTLTPMWPLFPSESLQSGSKTGR